jgi:hypothetical protein
MPFEAQRGTLADIFKFQKIIYGFANDERFLSIVPNPNRCNPSSIVGHKSVMQGGIGVLPISYERQDSGDCSKENSSKSCNQRIYFFKRPNNPAEAEGSVSAQKAFLCAGFIVFGIGWVVSLAAIGHGSLRIFLCAAIISIIGAMIALKMFVVLASPNRRSENIRGLPVVIAELKLGNIERHVFAAHFVERADHTALEDRPEAFDCLSVDCANDVLAPRMVNGSVREISYIRPIDRCKASSLCARRLRGRRQ